MNTTTRLRALIESKRMVLAPGAHDAFSAKLVEAAGFEAVYMSGFGTAASSLGIPDIGLLTMTEMVENAARIAGAVDIPVIADADTGYGNHLNVARTVREYQRAGVAAIQIEDQVAPKRCGHMEGHTLIAAEDMAAKIRAAVKARGESDVVIIARTDAISASGFEEAIRRGNLYRRAGADLLFIEAPTTLKQLALIPRSVDGPTMVNLAPKTPVLSLTEYERLGYALAIYPLVSINCLYASLKEELERLREQGLGPEGCAGRVPFADLVDFLGLADYRAREEQIMRG
jgi:2,3-dimethylmalate lyase